MYTGGVCFLVSGGDCVDPGPPACQMESCINGRFSFFAGKEEAREESGEYDVLGESGEQGSSSGGRSHPQVTPCQVWNLPPPPK